MRLLALLALTSCAPKAPIEDPAASADPLAEPIPFDSLVSRGALDNGMEWFIEENKEPQARAVLRLVVDTGSVLEDDDQLGLAHFVEHMAFNGTENFEGNELVDYLESIGMSFGPHLNAHTSFDETVYKLTVPTDDAATLEKGFMVLSEWAQSLSFDPDEIEKERGVVLEEWRRSRGAGGRYWDSVIEVNYHGSPYAERRPIGTEESLKTFDHEALKRFYTDWYRPDLMAVIAVGDFDPDTIQAHIEKYFGDMVNPDSPRERARSPIPAHDDVKINIFSDPEFTRVGFQLLDKQDHPEDPTYRGYRDGLLRGLAASVINERFGDISQQEDPPILGARAGMSRMTPTEGAAYVAGSTSEEGLMRGFEAALVELARFQRHGFTQAEMDRAVARRVQSFEKMYREKDTTKSATHVGELIRHYTNDESVPGVDREYELGLKYLNEFTLDELQAWVKGWMASGSLVIHLTLPQKEGLAVPTEDEVRALLADVAGREVEAPAEEVVDAPLLDPLPEPGEVVERGEIAELGVTTWVLSNGVEVWLKPTDFKADEILIRGWSPGGTSLIPDEQWIPSNTATGVRSKSGLADFDNRQLSKLLAGKSISTSPSISRFDERINASAAPRDLEAALQLMHLYFTNPAFTERGMGIYREGKEAAIANRLANPSTVFGDAYNELMWQGHVRWAPWTMETLEQFDLAASEAFFRARFADADDFRFVVVGNVDLEAVEPLLARYLGSLPSLDGADAPGDDGLRRVTGEHERTVRAGIEPKARFRMTLHGPFEGSWTERNHFGSMVDVLKVRLREELREERGGVYSVSASGSTYYNPEPEYRVTVDFQCDPERVDELMEAMYEVIEELRAGPIDASYVDAEKEKNRRGREESLRTNSFWRSAIVGAWKNGEDPLEILTWDARNDALTPEVVHAEAVKYLVLENVVEVRLLPEAAPPEEGATEVGE